MTILDELFIHEDYKRLESGNKFIKCFTFGFSSRKSICQNSTRILFRKIKSVGRERETWEDIAIVIGFFRYPFRISKRFVEICSCSFF